MPYFDGCIVPTPQTRLKWSPDYQHIVGMQHVQAGVEERFRQRAVVRAKAGKPKSFLGLKVPTADSVAYRREATMDEDVFV
eukprot:1824177-Rhodomonas_salina.1